MELEFVKFITNYTSLTTSSCFKSIKVDGIEFWLRLDYELKTAYNTFIEQLKSYYEMVVNKRTEREELDKRLNRIFAKRFTELESELDDKLNKRSKVYDV